MLRYDFYWVLPIHDTPEGQSEQWSRYFLAQFHATCTSLLITVLDARDVPVPYYYACVFGGQKIMEFSQISTDQYH